MKNKHLVFIFLLVAALGWLLRDMPWRHTERFEARLLRIEPDEVQSMAIQSPGRPVLSLERSDSGWLAQQDGRFEVAQADRVQNLLRHFCYLQSKQALPDNWQDSLLLDPKKALGITFKTRQGRSERLWLGVCMPCGDTRCTAVRVGSIEACFWVGGDLYEGLPQELAEFGQAYFPACIPDQITGIRLEGMLVDTFSRFRPINGRSWFVETDLSDSLPNAAVQQWLAQWLSLRAAARPADHVDEWRLSQHSLGRMSLQGPEGVQTLRLYHIPKPELPEELGSFPDKQVLTSTWFVRMEPSDGRYFALPDSVLVGRWLQATSDLFGRK